MCTGDSGGSLFLRQKNRYFQVSTFLQLKPEDGAALESCLCCPQVGVLSWGITNVCDPATRGKHSSDKPPPDARDFHIDLFHIMPWLKQHLGEEIQFLPDVN